jgi:transcription elongation GreA/GreB family factor
MKLNDTERLSGDRATPGALIRVQDDAGETIDYELVGTRRVCAGASHVSVASPTGAALLGARQGDVVKVRLPGGRDRSLYVISVCA